MFEILLSGFLDTLFSLLWWSWAHPDLAGLALSGTALFLIGWLHVPPVLEYYWQRGQVTVRPINVRNEIARHVSGRVAVISFCRQHGIRLALRQRIGRTFLEFFLKVFGIPDPRDFSWDGGFAAIQVYPLGHSRREYINLCLARRIWPWKRAKTLQRILDEHGGYLPGLEQATFLASLGNRIRS
ncbi:MAG: hypothetical protein KBB77_02290 [Candidatus Moranbacteria bacterium]|nr:hypothetical protein [Candidatus Moranbacteria bacterium]